MHKQYTLEDPTNLEGTIFKVVESLADKLCDSTMLYRTVSISLTQFIDERNTQLNLFIDEYERKEMKNWPKRLTRYIKNLVRVSYLKQSLIQTQVQNMGV